MAQLLNSDLHNLTLKGHFESFGEEKIVFTPSKENELGSGSGGTRVYRGMFGKRKVAVKQLTDFKNLEEAQREIEMLSQYDNHENVIRYYGKEVRPSSIVLALELANATLEDWVIDKNCIHPAAINDKSILAQTTEGLMYLHDQKIIHKDLKPSNILLAVLSEKKVLVKISDFGISRVIGHGRMSRTVTSVSGTEDWMAPELIVFAEKARMNRKEQMTSDIDRTTMTTNVDIFALGCVYYYVLTNGHHPFGNEDTHYNIKHGKIVMAPCQHTLDIKCNINLLKTMISHNPKNRPAAVTILADPIFWTYQQVLQFLVDVSDFVEDVMSGKKSQCQTPFYKEKENCVLSLETAYGPEICKGHKNGWFHATCDVVRSYLEKGKLTKSSCDSVLKLIRVIRNWRNHYEQQEELIQKAVGKLPNDYMIYWLERFPLLVYHVRNAFHSFSQEDKLKPYFCDAKYLKNDTMTMSKKPIERFGLGDKPKPDLAVVKENAKESDNIQFEKSKSKLETARVPDKKPDSSDVKTDKKGVPSIVEGPVYVKNKGSYDWPSQLLTKYNLISKNPVSMLLELAAKQKWTAPKFELCFEDGPPHNPQFLYSVNLNGIKYKPSVPVGVKKEAKADAAALCLQSLGKS